VLAHLRNGDTYLGLAAGFGVGTTTAWRYVREAVDLLAARADDVKAAIARAAALAYAILDGTLIPIDRVHDQKPYYSGKHKRHGVNVQVIADPLGRLIWASPALPGAAHDLTAARTLGIIDGLTSANVMAFAVIRDTKAPAAASARRSNATDTDPGCHDATDWAPVGGPPAMRVLVAGW
jgi:hypothetical protein